jgi:chorismate synthase
VILRLAVKPTSSISRPQQTINSQHEPAEIIVKGRHDPCISPRVVPVAEAMTALVIYDLWLTQSELNESTVPTIEEWDWDAIEQR